LEELALAVRDYIRPMLLVSGQFKDLWETVGADTRSAEVIQTFQVQFKAMEEAV